MRPLPRLLAFTSDAICADDAFPARAAAVLSAGSAVAVVIDAPNATPEQRRRYLDRLRALARPPEASLIASDDPTLGGLCHGVLMKPRGTDLAAARRAVEHGWLGAIVASSADADRAVRARADFLVVADINAGLPPTDHQRAPTSDLPEIIQLGRPVFVSLDPESDQLDALRHSGAWGLATAAVFHAADPARATADLLARWVV